MRGRKKSGGRRRPEARLLSPLKGVGLDRQRGGGLGRKKKKTNFPKSEQKEPHKLRRVGAKTEEHRNANDKKRPNREG